MSGVVFIIAYEKKYPVYFVVAALFRYSTGTMELEERRFPVSTLTRWRACVYDH